MNTLKSSYSPSIPVHNFPFTLRSEEDIPLPVPPGEDPPPPIQEPPDKPISEPGSPVGEPEPNAPRRL